jgi:hypothetical protein
MKYLFIMFTAISVLACNGEFVEGGHQFFGVQKIIITGLPAVTGRGADVKVKIGYLPNGKSWPNSQQEFKVYSESGEYLFKEEIDIYYLDTVPNKNPPEYKFSGTFDNKVLTVNVQKYIDPGCEVQKLIIRGLPAVTSWGEDIHVKIGYIPAGESPSNSEPIFKVYTQSGEYLFPEGKGIDIISMGFVPEMAESEYYMGDTDTMWGADYIDHIEKIIVKKHDVLEQNFNDVHKIIISGLPAVTSWGEEVELRIRYRETALPPSTPNDFVKVFTESGEYLFPEGIDIIMYYTRITGLREYTLKSSWNDECLKFDIDKR